MYFLKSALQLTVFMEKIMDYQHITIPQGDFITCGKDGKLSVSDTPVIGFIEGDGVGPDIMAASKYMWDAAVEKAYGGKKRISWELQSRGLQESWTHLSVHAQFHSLSER